MGQNMGTYNSLSEWPIYKIDRVSCFPVQGSKGLNTNTSRQHAAMGGYHWLVICIKPLHLEKSMSRVLVRQSSQSSVSGCPDIVEAHRQRQFCVHLFLLSLSSFSFFYCVMFSSIFAYSRAVHACAQHQGLLRQFANWEIEELRRNRESQRCQWLKAKDIRH